MQLGAFGLKSTGTLKRVKSFLYLMKSKTGIHFSVKNQTNFVFLRVFSQVFYCNYWYARDASFSHLYTELKTAFVM